MTGLNAGAKVTTAKSVSLSTAAEPGAYTFPNGTFTIEGDPNGVTFVTDGNSNVKDIRDFAGTLTSTENEVTVNGAEIYTSNTDASISSAGVGVSAIRGIGDNDTVTAPENTSIAVEASGTDTVTVNVNGKPYELTGDEDGCLSGAQIKTGAAGLYIVNDTPLDASIGATIVGDPEGSAHVYDPGDITINENTDTEEIIKQVSGNTEDGELDKYVQHLNEEETQDLMNEVLAGNTSNADGNLELKLTNTATDTTTQNADFSQNKGIKKVTLQEGAQNVSFNDEGGNIAIVSSESTGSKNIELGNGGDIAIIEKTDTPVNVKAGRGKDNIVSSGRRTNVDLSAGGATKVMVNGTNNEMHLEGYDHNTGAGVQLTNSDVKLSVRNNVIELNDGTIGVNGAKVVIDANPEATGSAVVNFYNLKGKLTKVGYTHSEGGTVDLTGENGDVVMKGNYTNGAQKKQGGSILRSGAGNDVAFGGAGDNFDLGAGDNEIELDTDRSVADNGAVINQTATRGKTEVTGFHFDYGVGGDRVNIDLSAGVKFAGGILTFMLGAAQLMLTNTTSAVGDAADIAESADTATSSRIGTENDGVNKVSQKVLVGDSENALRVEVAQANGVMKVERVDGQLTQAYIGAEGEGSGVNVGDFEEDALINLNEGNGIIGGESVYLRDINKLQGGTGNSSLIGASNANNTLVAGTGNTSMWGAGAGNDSLVGVSTDIKLGTTTFFYMKGDGRDSIENFEFRTYDNAGTADKIDTYGTYLKSGDVINDDVIISLEGLEDRLTLKNARGKNVQIHIEGNDMITAQLNTDTLDYDGIADYLQVTGKNGTVKVNSSLTSAEIWLNNDRTKWTGTEGKPQTFVGDIKVLNASEMEGQATLVGNNNDNVITAAQGNTSMWGGNHNESNDTLIGGFGDDKFWYGLNEGDDVINNVESNDLINLYNIKVEDVKSLDVTATQIKATFTGGHSLTINTSNSGVGFRTEDGTTWTVDQQTRVWSTK